MSFEKSAYSKKRKPAPSGKLPKRLDQGLHSATCLCGRFPEYVCLCLYVWYS